MENQKSAKVISIIALIISIIALLISLLICYGKCPCCNNADEKASEQCTQSNQDITTDQGEGEGTAQVQVVEEGESAPQRTNIDLTEKKKKAQVFVDLGLPSGTLWRDMNEEAGLMTYEDALATYGKQLPSKKQYTELLEKCTWKKLKNGGYKVVGPNGNYIVFPYDGFINCTGELRGVNEFGDYWTSTAKEGSEEAWRVVFSDKKEPSIILHNRCYARGIRIVKKQ